MPEDFASAAQTFYDRVAETFRFLVDEYRFHLDHQKLIYPEEPRDTMAQVGYLGSHIAVRILWYFDSAAMSVGFLELLTPGVFPPEGDRTGRNPALPRLLSLADIARANGRYGDPAFQLDRMPFGSQRSFERRAAYLESNMVSILNGLASLMQELANPLLTGNTSVFDEIMPRSQ